MLFVWTTEGEMPIILRLQIANDPGDLVQRISDRYFSNYHRQTHHKPDQNRVVFRIGTARLGNQKTSSVRYMKLPDAPGAVRTLRQIAAPSTPDKANEEATERIFDAIRLLEGCE